MTALNDNSCSVETFVKCKLSSQFLVQKMFASEKANSFPSALFFTVDLKNNNKDRKWIMKRLNFLENVAVDNFMKMKLDKMVVIKIESRQMKRNQRKLKLGT